MWKMLFKKYWISIILAPIFMTGEVVADLLQPYYMNRIIDDGVLGISSSGVGDTSLVMSLGLRMIIIVLLGVLSAVITGIFAHSCGQLFGNDLRKKCFHNVMTLSFAQIQDIGESSLTTRLLNDISQIQQLVRMSISAFVRTFILFAGGIICMLRLDIHFGLIVLLVLPVISFLIVVFMRQSNRIFGVLQNRIDTINKLVQENLMGARVVKAFVREKYEQERFKTENEKLVDSQLQALLIFAKLTPLINIVMNVAVVLIIMEGGIRVRAGGITPGTVIAAITYITQILNAVLALNMIFQTVSRGSACAKRIQEILDMKPDIVGGDIKEEATYEPGRIEFKNVSFAYPDTSEGMVLDDISFSVDSGETVGILGSTGSGKSSLVQLIPRFWDIKRGKILIDGIDIKNYSLESLRSKVSIVFQNSEIFSESFEDNIKWGNRTADESSVRDAAKTAQAIDFIEDRENGFKTMISQNGTSISGGQKQRIAISRGILKKGEILIMDDSTSALDFRTERKLLDSLNEMYPDMTKVIVAQRITSIINADRILVMDKGRIIGQGRHEELLKNNKIYLDIYNSQLQSGGI